jgi:hypothetical protein
MEEEFIIPGQIGRTVSEQRRHRLKMDRLKMSHSFLRASVACDLITLSCLSSYSNMNVMVTFKALSGGGDSEEGDVRGFWVVSVWGEGSTSINALSSAVVYISGSQPVGQDPQWGPQMILGGGSTDD